VREEDPMPQVAIPARHFTNSVKKNYQEHKSALIREFVQNSVDAGAKSISFQFDEDNRSLTIQDDGCGMTRDVLVNALLTMSGSYKGTNSIGGFGAAKEILLFQHYEYRITTRKDDITTAVIGRQLDYEFVDGFGGLEDDGTVFTILFHEDFEICGFETSAKCYLRNCQIDQEVIWNGQKINSFRERGELIDKGIDWADIYVKEDTGYSHSMLVRINGVMMFSVFVDTKFDVIVEITKPSLEILTVNRDGFVWSYQHKLQKLIYHVSVEKGQFGKTFNAHEVWHGAGSSYDDVSIDLACILEHSDEKFSEDELKHFERAVKKIEQAARSKAADMGKKSVAEAATEIKKVVEETAYDEGIPHQLIERMVEHANHLVCDHAADFYIKVTGTGFDKIPDNLCPGQWGKRTMTWAKLWKHCLKIIMKSNGLDMPYSIGWVIDNDEETQAMYEKVDGVNVFYMNPMLTWMRSSVHHNVFHKMLMNACHEVAHAEHQHHDENFILYYEDMLHRALSYLTRKGNSWWKAVSYTNLTLPTNREE